MGRTVLVTGVSRYLGGLFAQALSREPDVDRILGVDIVPPPHGIGRAEFVRADIRSPMIARVMTQERVDTVVHMSVIATPLDAGGRSSQKEINVIGTMQLLAACQKTPTLERLVVKSSASVYGSSNRDPALFVEGMTPRSMPRSGFAKDMVEVEGYVRGFSRRRPHVELTMIRFANVLGPGIRTSMTDYFSMPLVPIPMGFDPRLQFTQEDDAVGALARATTGPVAGLVNVAGDGFLTGTQAAALAGRATVPFLPGTSGLIGTVARRVGSDFPSDQINLITFGRGLDTTRMREVLGYHPTYTTREAFTTYAARLAPAFPGFDGARQLTEGALTALSRRMSG